MPPNEREKALKQEYTEQMTEAVLMTRAADFYIKKSIRHVRRCLTIAKRLNDRMRVRLLEQAIKRLERADTEMQSNTAFISLNRHKYTKKRTLNP